MNDPLRELPTIHFVDPDDLRSVASDRTLAALLRDGRVVVCVLEAEVDGKRRLAIVLGPVPTPPSLVRRAWPVVVAAVALAVAAIVGALG